MCIAKHVDNENKKKIKNKKSRQQKLQKIGAHYLLCLQRFHMNFAALLFKTKEKEKKAESQPRNRENERGRTRQKKKKEKVYP